MGRNEQGRSGVGCCFVQNARWPHNVEQEHMTRWLALFVLGPLFLTACVPRNSIGKGTHFGLQTVNSGFGIGQATFDYQLTSSMNCAVIGEPLSFTLILTNTSTQTYSDTLPVSIVDLQATSTLTTTEHTWLWSDNTPDDEQFRTLALAPNESLWLQWRWLVDPRLQGAPPPVDVVIRPLIRYRDRYRNGEIVELRSEGRLGIPVGGLPAGSCPTPIPNP